MNKNWHVSEHSCGTDNRIQVMLTQLLNIQWMDEQNEAQAYDNMYRKNKKLTFCSCSLQHKEIIKVLSWGKEAGTNYYVF